MNTGGDGKYNVAGELFPREAGVRSFHPWHLLHDVLDLPHDSWQVVLQVEFNDRMTGCMELSL